jgi:hypothetical protein
MVEPLPLPFPLAPFEVIADEVVFLGFGPTDPRSPASGRCEVPS